MHQKTKLQFPGTNKLVTLQPLNHELPEQSYGLLVVVPGP